MPESSRVFVDVDTQRDFLEPGGTLFIEGSSAIRGNLRRLADYARDREIFIIATACAHTPDEPDPEPFPPHCLLGTPGQSRIDETARPDGVILPVGESFPADRPLPAHLTIEKQRYDAFSRPDTAELIARYAADDPLFVVYGVATDYCVKCMVLGLRGAGYRVAVVTDAIHAVDESATAAVLDEFQRRGATLTTTDEVCGDDASNG